MLGLSLMLLVTPLSAGDEQPLRLYMPDGQLKSYSIRVSEGIR